MLMFNGHENGHNEYHFSFLHISTIRRKTGREMLFLFSFLFYDENSHNHWQTYKHFHMHIVQHTRAGVNEHENKGGYTYKFLSTKMDKMLIRWD